MVMLPKPAEPLLPVTVKDKVVDAADWFVVIVTLDICELVMFPFKVSSTVAPLSVVAGTVVEDGEGVGDGAGEGVGDGEGEVVVDEESPPPPLELGVGVGLDVDANVAVIV
jgi:hypothetical protein